MLTTNTQASLLEIKKTFKAPLSRVFKAWTEPEQMTQWFGCGKAQEVHVEQDFRVGGDFCVEVACSDGEQVRMSGTFLEIVPNAKLVYTWNNTSSEFPASDTLVKVEFIDKGDSTEIVLQHSKFNRPVSVQGHTMGWTACFEKLEALLQ